MKYLNKDNLHIFPHEIVKAVESITKRFNHDINEKHKKITSIILDDFKRKDYKVMTENITRAGFIRGFLG